jgi:hypothetical protein
VRAGADQEGKGAVQTVLRARLLPVLLVLRVLRLLLMQSLMVLPLPLPPLLRGGAHLQVIYAGHGPQRQHDDLCLRGEAGRGEAVLARPPRPGCQCMHA